MFLESKPVPIINNGSTSTYVSPNVASLKIGFAIFVLIILDYLVDGGLNKSRKFGWMCSVIFIHPQILYWVCIKFGFKILRGNHWMIRYLFWLKTMKHSSGQKYVSEFLICVNYHNTKIKCSICLFSIEFSDDIKFKDVCFISFYEKCLTN